MFNHWHFNHSLCIHLKKQNSMSLVIFLFSLGLSLFWVTSILLNSNHIYFSPSYHHLLIHYSFIPSSSLFWVIFPPPVWSFWLCFVSHSCLFIHLQYFFFENANWIIDIRIVSKLLNNCTSFEVSSFFTSPLLLPHIHVSTQVRLKFIEFSKNSMYSYL